MPSQFEILVQKLDEILELLKYPPQYLSLDSEVPSGLDKQPMGSVAGRHVQGEVPEAPRTRIEYRTINGDIDYLDPQTLEPKVRQVMEIAKTQPDPWQLYEGEDGTIRIMASHEVVRLWQARYGR